MVKKILGVVTGVLFLLPSYALAITPPEQLPEPSSLLLIGAAFAALLGFRKALK